MARQGQACGAWQGKARQARRARQARHSKVRPELDRAWQGRRGKARRGEAWLDWAPAGVAWRGIARQGRAWTGTAGEASPGAAERGLAWRDAAGTARQRRGQARQAWQGMARPSEARLGKATTQRQKKVTDPEVIAELNRIAEANPDGILTPEAVVDAARPKGSCLHEFFDWKDSEAAQKWRLHQARNLIRVTVEFLPSETDPMEVRVFVSLTPDRRQSAEGGGYRKLSTVMANEQHRAQLLADALREMKLFEAKFRMLKELTAVFRAMKRAWAKVA